MSDAPAPLGAPERPWPTVTFAAEVADDRLTHVVVAKADAVADDRVHLTCCGRPATELHGKPRDISCTSCAEVSGVSSTDDFPPERVL
jgi:hypothetical protein